MYSDTELDDAIRADVLSPEAVSAFRQHVTSLRATPVADEEQFRLLTGFNDIFVAIAGTLLLVGLVWVGGGIHPGIGAALVAAASWGLSEYFTRVRRMALPSIIFLLAFVGGVFATCASLLGFRDPLLTEDTTSALLLSLAAAIAAAAAYLHWRRFMVPITIAAGAAAAAVTAGALIKAAVPDVQSVVYPLMAASGVAIFALAMYWDISDRRSQTRRSDVAFWLHLLAAPLFVHPVFRQIGILGTDNSIVGASLVLGLYVVLGVVALAIDRRALMVSALAYVLIAVGALFREFGAVGFNVSLTVLIIGSALLLLSAFWQAARGWALGLLPRAISDKLPPTAVAASLQRA